MGYVPVLSPSAEQSLIAQPEPLRLFIADAINRLAENPSLHSKASSMIARGQLADFEFRNAGAVVFVTVTFLYGSDEQTLFIEEIAVEFAG